MSEELVHESRRATADVSTHDAPRASWTPYSVFLVALGLVGLIATAVVVMLGLRFVDRSGMAIADSLTVTADAVEAFDETIVILADSVDIVAQGLDTVTSTVETSEETLEEIGGLLTATSQGLSAEIPESIDAIRETMPGLIQSAELVDRALGSLSFLGVDFAPQNPPAESLRRVDTGLAELSARLRAISGRLGVVGRDLSDFAGDAVSLADRLGGLSANLVSAELLLESYAETTTRTAELVAATSAELDEQRSEGRLVVLLFGLIVGLGQIVPIVVGVRSREAVGV